MEKTEPAFLPYGHQTIDDDDVRAVVDVLRSDWLTTGPSIDTFEKAVADFAGASHAVAVSNGTAALHAMMHAAGIGAGDEVIVPAITFAATSNAVLYCGGKPVFADVAPGTLLLDPEDVKRKITKNTKAVVAVDYAGQPCDYESLRAITNKQGIMLMADACHSLGATYKNQPIGKLADMSALSFHPVKHITTGEGGMVLASDQDLAATLRRFRNHGITTDHRQRSQAGKFYYEMVDLGFNYRMTDIQAALGISQLKKLPKWLETRRKVACQYHGHFLEAFGKSKKVVPLESAPETLHAYHLYVVRLASDLDRDAVFKKLRDQKIGVNVHYLPVHLHPYYESLGYSRGLCPVAESAYPHLLSLPIFQGMTDADVVRVVTTVQKVVTSF